VFKGEDGPLPGRAHPTPHARLIMAGWAEPGRPWNRLLNQTNGAAMRKIDIKQSLETFEEHWSPKIVGEVNDSYVKLVKFKGEFVWHHHDAEDEMFLVVKGRMLMKLRDGDITVEEGQFIIIPRGVEHMPVAEEEAHVLLFEPRSTLNTGNVRNERTLPTLERI
jgi:mannose-6-phosphate isomerase-like protein (cupin superfamily)